jgi:hypothetical protein
MERQEVEVELGVVPLAQTDRGVAKAQVLYAFVRGTVTVGYKTLI